MHSCIAVVSRNVLQDIIELAEPLLEPSRVANGRRPLSNICPKYSTRTCLAKAARTQLAISRVILSSADQQLMLSDRTTGE